MIKKIKSLLQENRDLHRKNSARLRELEWANAYHDSIRGEDWINKESLNIGRWASGYGFFFILLRILKDARPKRVLELGLGESSKFISKFAENHDYISKHLIIEHDQSWKDKFLETFILSKYSEVKVCPLVDSNVQGFQNMVYKNFEDVTEGEFDLFLIDGPFGSANFSRYEIISKIEQFNHDTDFIILFDDVHRKGEQETLNKIELIMKEKGLIFHKRILWGNNSTALIVSEKYKFLITV